MAGRAGRRGRAARGAGGAGAPDPLAVQQSLGGVDRRPHQPRRDPVGLPGGGGEGGDGRKQPGQRLGLEVPDPPGVGQGQRRGGAAKARQQHPRQADGGVAAVGLGAVHQGGEGGVAGGEAQAWVQQQPAELIQGQRSGGQPMADVAAVQGQGGGAACQGGEGGFQGVERKRGVVGHVSSSCEKDRSGSAND